MRAGNALTRRLAGHYHHAGANLNTAEKVLDVLVQQPDATRGNGLPDRRGLVGAVDAIERVAEIESARAEWIARATCHDARQIGLALDHLRRREPVRPFLHARDALRARPGEAFAADADAVAQRLAVPEHEIKVGVRRIDDERARRLLSRKIDQLLFQIGR